MKKQEKTNNDEYYYLRECLTLS